MRILAPIRFAAVVVLAVFVAGCGLKGMREVAPDRAAVKPPADQAAIVFMRSAATAATTSLFELSSSEQPRFIGLLVQNTRMVYLTAPGRTRFMVVGRSASFLDADLAAGKTYEVVILLGDGVEEHFRLVPRVARRPGGQPCGRGLPGDVQVGGEHRPVRGVGARPGIEHPAQESRVHAEVGAPAEPADARRGRRTLRRAPKDLRAIELVEVS